MEGCVSEEVLCAGRRGAWRRLCLPSLCHPLPAILSPPSSTPPSMCCLWIRLIKAPQIRSPGRGREGEFALTSTYTHFFNECRIQDTVHAKLCTGVFPTSTLDHFLMCTGKLKVLNYGFPSIFVENYQSLWSAGQRFSPFMHHMPAYAKRAAHIWAPSPPVLASARASPSIFIGHRQKTSGPEKNQQAISEMMADKRDVRFSL